MRESKFKITTLRLLLALTFGALASVGAVAQEEIGEEAKHAKFDIAPRVQINLTPDVSDEARSANDTATSLRVPAARPATIPPPALQPVGFSLDKQKTLSLRESIEMALANNPDIELSRQSVRSAEFDLTGARGAYDVRFLSSSAYERAETPTTSFFTVGRGTSGLVTESAVTGSLRLEGLTPRAGGSYNVEFTSGRATTNNLFANLGTLYPTTLSFNYTQPILRGRRFDSTRRRIEIARRNLSLTDQQFRQQTMHTIARVQAAYWDVVFSLRDLQVQQQSLKDAREQLAHVRRRVERGALAPVDVVSTERQVARLDADAASALDAVARAQNALKNLIAPDEHDALWDQAILPTDEVSLNPSVVTLTEAMETALANRPELQQIETRRAINDIDRRYFREETRPQVDLVASYSLNGLAGSLASGTTVDPFTSSLNQLQDRVNTLSQTANLPPLTPAPAPVTPGFLVGDYGQSLSNLSLNRFNTVRVGVQISVPFRNRAARAALGNSLVERERIATSRRQIAQAIRVEVGDALQSVRTAEARLVAAVRTREASEREYASEQRKYDAGREGASIFLVLERQTRLTEARGDEVRALTDLNKALAELERATGSTLRANGMIAGVH